MDQLKQCVYCDKNCNGFQPLNDTEEYSGIQIAFHHSGMLRVRVFKEDEEFVPHVVMQDVINLQICPKCGRSL